MSTQISGTTGIDTVQDNTVTSAKIVAGTVAFIDLLGTDWTSSLASSGYQKLPTGLIIQWGTGSASVAGVTNTFPLAFPSACYVVVANNNNQTNPPSPSVDTLSTTSFRAVTSAGAPTIYFLAIGR